MCGHGVSEKQKMLNGELYNAMDPELVAERRNSEKLILRLNMSRGPEERDDLLRTLLGEVGEGTIVRTPFFCDYGYNICLGRNVFINFNCVLLDVLPIRIGDGTQIGPAVQIYAADHPRDRETRLAGLESGKTVTVGMNVWIGGGAILLPGITVGDDAIIGAGAVVTRDVRAGETVAGNPARRLA
jgi:maltose O-acetyltransferase